MRHTRFVAGLASALALLSTASPVRAEKAVAKLMLHATSMVTRHEGVSPSVALGQDEPDLLADRDLHYGTDGQSFGGGLMGSFMVDGTRFALGISFFGVRDTKIVHDPLPAGYELEAGRLWGETVELRLGREFALGPLFPYLDLRFAFVIEAVNTQLRSESQGLLGSTQYNRYALGLGPVGGVFLPAGDAFVDISGYAGLFGQEKYGGTVGVGLWTDL